MSKPIGFYAGAIASHPDSVILDRITEQFGSQLEEVSHLSKAAVLICLVDSVTNASEVLVKENWLTSENGKELWSLAEQLSEPNQLMLALAIMHQLAYAGRQYS
ncbi:MAG: hypothetical protein ICV63_00530 [Coleofasciculus sp. Co-bin14]|nr:hypothetical protein [Coleofasciculus sp. Co-bin14]